MIERVPRRVETDVVREGRPVVGYGFCSNGRYAQSGIIRDRLEWGEVVQEIHQYANAEGLSLTPDALIGWSGGANGITNALAEGHDFPSVLLADPSPVREAFSGPNTRVWYNPKNWKGSLAHLGPKQAQYAQPLGNRAILVQLDHNQILDEVIKIALTERKATFPPALLIGVPVFLIALALAIRARRE